MSLIVASGKVEACLSRNFFRFTYAPLGGGRRRLCAGGRAQGADGRRQHRRPRRRRGEGGRSSSGARSSRGNHAARQVIDISRRQMLRGDRRRHAGACRSCRRCSAGRPTAPTRLFTRPPRLYWVTTDHGGAFEASMFPSTSLLTASQALYSDHTVRSGALVPTTSGSDTVVSPVLRAPSSSLSAALVAKMNVLWGLDVPFYIAHNTGLHLGNYARNDGNGGDGKAVQAFPRPTIDQIMAWSPSFYSEPVRHPRARDGHVGPAGVVELQRPGDDIQRDPERARLFELAGAVQQDLRAADAARPAPRAPIVDSVLANYNRLRQSNKRLSAADKQRLDDHVARIAELQRKLTTTVSGASCSSVTDADRQRQQAQRQHARGRRQAAAALERGRGGGVHVRHQPDRRARVRRHVALRVVRRRLAPGGRAPVAARRPAGAAGAVVPALLRVGVRRHGAGGWTASRRRRA